MNEKHVSHYKKPGPMLKRVPGSRYFYAALFTVILAFFYLPYGQASDHGDEEGEQGFARLTDLYTFVRGDNLVIALCSNPNPPTQDEFHFPSEVTYKIHIDNHSKVTFADEANNKEFGGTVVNPENIQERITFTITFKNHKPKLEAVSSSNMLPNVLPLVQFFAGLRDDPFIRNPRNGKNVAAIVLELPVKAVTAYRQKTLLIWATSEIEGTQIDHVGRALRSMFEEALNALHPKDHVSMGGVKVPDVMICDTSECTTSPNNTFRNPSKFPNCRELMDDVVQYLVCERYIDSLAEFCYSDECKKVRSNDKAFYRDFPYLAEPH